MKQMEKKYVLVAFLAVFLMLSVPLVKSLEFQNQKKIIESEVEALDCDCLVETVEQMAKYQRLALLKNILQKAGGNEDNETICLLAGLLYLIGFVFIIGIIGIPILFLANYLDKKYDCRIYTPRPPPPWLT